VSRWSGAYWSRPLKAWPTLWLTWLELMQRQLTNTSSALALAMQCGQRLVTFICFGRRRHLDAANQVASNGQFSEDYMGRLIDTLNRSPKICHRVGVRVSGEVGFPSNTMWPMLRPTTMPNFILIHPTVWPQYTNVTDRTDRQDRQSQTDNGPIA